ncbi:Cof-type HAD-IIB family hydrolase [symbiont of Argiope bruennichi]|uniref:Cof-type HAD-IIB family hydrolase n=1 Tax=symbiont of Argiope bruennichi TaxID=2810479 RepID=UPI003DA359F4
MQLKPSFNDYKILFIDLDGTLLNDKSCISDENIKYLKKFREKNIFIVICTGRPLNNVIDKCETIIFEKNEKNIFIVASNGAEIFDYSQNKILNESVIPLNLVAKIWKYCEAKQLFIFAFFNHKKNFFLINTFEKFFQDTAKHVLYHCEEFLCIPKVVSSNDFKSNHYLLNKIHIINYLNNHQKIINDLYLLSNNNVDISLSSDAVLEITNKGINKGYGVKFICDKLNIPLEHTISIGDNGNDISMFQVTGLSATLKSAADIAKNNAKIIIDKTNNESIIKHLYQLFEE